MYAIFYQCELIGICDQPMYVKPHPARENMYMPATEEDATGITVQGTKYSIEGKGVEVYPGAPVAEVRNIDGASSYLFNAFMKSIQAERDCNDLDTAVIDLGDTTQEQYEDLSNAVLELAEVVTSNNA